MQNEFITEKGKVSVIWGSAPKQRLESNEVKNSKPIRVAAYCRVSTDLDEQTDSFELQERYYTRLITSSPGWRLAGIYADQGVTGTQRTQRIGFQRMIRHCEEGKIDRIMCKSISRFARNTMDLLDSVRTLKGLGISVVFEKEGIDTLSEQSEFVLSTIAAIAQEESRNTSENMTLAFNKRFQLGIPVFKRILGYEVERCGGERTISINEREAEIVREIFSLTLEGIGYTQIIRILMQKRCKTVKGSSEWGVGMIKGILTNERYTGDVLCQKTYTADYLTHKCKQNVGEKQQYLIENHHPAIISHEIFEKVNEILQNNLRNRPKEHVVYPFTGRIKCGNCGANYHRYNSDCYARWKCSKGTKSKELCNSESIGERDLEEMLIKAFQDRFIQTDKNLLHVLKRDLKQIQENDNIERDRVILKRELALALNQEIFEADNKELPAIERTLIEEKLRNSEEYWNILEKDRVYRVKTLEWLENLPRGENGSREFFEKLNLEYIRAWVIGITIQSPISFAIRWFDNTETTISE